MPTCSVCQRFFRAATSLRIHQYRDHGADNRIPIAVVSYTNIALQSFSCPVPDCSYVCKDNKTTQGIFRHVACKHAAYELIIQYNCQICDIFLDPTEVAAHSSDHLEDINDQGYVRPLAEWVSIQPTVSTSEPPVLSSTSEISDAPISTPRPTVLCHSTSPVSSSPQFAIDLSSTSTPASCSTNLPPRHPPAALNPSVMVSPLPLPCFHRPNTPRPSAADFFSPEQSTPRQTTTDPPASPNPLRLPNLPLLDTVCLEELPDDTSSQPNPPSFPSRPASPTLNISTFENIDPPDSPTADPSPLQPLHSNPTSPSSHLDSTVPPAAPTDEISINPDPAAPTTSQFVTTWSSKIASSETFDDFANLCTSFATAATLEGKTLAARLYQTKHRNPPPRRPMNRHPSQNRRRLTYNANDASRIQSLYRHSRKRATRNIIQGNSTPYSGSTETAHHFFKSMYADNPIDLDALTRALQKLVPSTTMDDSLMSPFSQPDILQRLSSMSNTAPGKDKVEYQHLRLIDPEAQLLHLILNRCLLASRVPKQWQEATTILIHKKGPADDPSNFRPIALMSCLYKLFMSLLSTRVSTIAIEANLMSPNQKSARPHEGCHEHTFTLQSIIADAKRNQKDCFIAWLDLRNAFGSIPHDAIYHTLAHMGFPMSFIHLIQNSYNGSTTTIRTADGETAAIPILSGVKQGCPISAILFNLTSELLIRAIADAATSDPTLPYYIHNHPVSVLAYADDLVLISRSKHGLQTFLDSTSTAADILNLSFRPDKCSSLSLLLNKRSSSIAGSRIGSSIFSVQSTDIPAMAKDDSVKYLGVPFGLLRQSSDFENITTRLVNDLELIRDSLLAPWQKLDAIRTFIQPCLTYALRASPITQASLKEYHNSLTATLRKILNLPRRTTNSYFFASKQAGGLSLQNPYDERHIQTIVQAMKMLKSSDPLVTSIAHDQLHSVVKRCLRRDPTEAEIDAFLSGSMAGDLSNHGSASNGQTLWSRARISARHLNLSFRNARSDHPQVVNSDKATGVPKTIASFLHHTTRRAYDLELRAKPDQGKVARAVENDQYATSSSWLFSGDGIRFCDWRFIHRARTNTLPTNAAKSRWSETSPSCRRCHNPTQPETLPHILCHCHPNMVSIRERHDRIVTRLSKAIYRGEVTLDQTVPDTMTTDRPDIVVRDGNEVIIIDVACPFENDSDALQTAADRKCEKYNYLKNHFSTTGKNAKVFGFIIGALGTWYPKNEEVLNALRISKKYRKLFRKLCCTDAIQGSRNIYVEHLTNQKQ